LFESPDTTQADSPAVNVEELNDVATKYMFPSEDAKAHESNRPSQGWLHLMEWLVREIAIGLNLPFGVAWNMAGLGGPAARFEINQAGRTFLATTEVLERRWIRPIAGWVTAKHISAGRLPFHPNWTQFSIARPRYITIDLGRESKAGIEENKAGLYTATDWFEEDGGDFEEKTERLAQEEAFRIKMAEKYKIKPESIRMLTPNGNDPGEKKEEEVQREKTPAR
jgi:capsid protein